MTYGSGAYTLDLSDTTAPDNWTFTVTIPFSGGQNSSAEWIVERPEVCDSSCSLAPLADFGTVTISNAQSATTGGPASINGFSSSALNMESDSRSTRLDESGALDPTGENFTVTWEAEGP